MVYRFILFCILFPLNIYTQENSIKNRIFFEGNIQYGFVSPHHNTISYFVNEHIQSFQFNVGILSSGKKSWQFQYNNPSIGIGYHYSSLGNKNVYGTLNAFYGFFDRYFFDNNRHFNIGNRASLGIGIINKPYNLYSNPFNMAFSSHINIYAHYSLFSELYLLKQTRLKLGFGVTHVSNGNTKKPNQGLNIITVFAGLRYLLHTSPPNYRVNPTNTFSDSALHKFNINLFTGFKSISRLNNNKYFVSGITLGYSYRLFKNNWLGIEITNYIDKSLIHEIQFIHPEYEELQTDNWRTTLNFNYEMVLGDFSVLLQPGFYLRNKFKAPGLISNKAGIKYRIAHNIYTSILIKAHWRAIADVLEWGIGYQFKK